MTAGHAVLLAAGGLVAGAINAAAGGGSLVSFPALLAAGYPALTANLTNTVSLCPGYLGGVIGYRAELRGQRARALRLGAFSAVGAGIGVVLLRISGQSSFRAVVPWLVLAASALLAVQPWVARWTRERGRRPELHAEHRSAGLAVATVLGGAYGAYFGAGLGVAQLGVLAIFLTDGMQRLNALKGLLSLVINWLAAILFAIIGPVAWPAVAVIAPASLIGGRLGVFVARRLSDRALRLGIVVFGVGVGIALLVT